MRILRMQKSCKGYMPPEVGVCLTTFARMDMRKLQEMAKRFR